jgi:hypothetical protein
MGYDYLKNAIGRDAGPGVMLMPRPFGKVAILTAG